MIEEQNKAIQLVNDINSCLSCDRIDEMMYRFLHIYEQLKDKVRTNSGAEYYAKEFNKLLQGKDKNYKNFKRQIDLYYQLIKGDEGRLLLDPKVIDTPTYQLDTYLYDKLCAIKLNIVNTLGRIKNELREEGWIDLNF